MRLEALVREYLIEIEVRKYTPKTIRGYRNNLNLFLRFCLDELGITTMDEMSIGAVRQFSKRLSDRGRKGTYINGLLKNIKAIPNKSHNPHYTTGAK